MAYQDFNSVDIPTFDFAKDPADKLAYSFDFSELAEGQLMSNANVTGTGDVIVTNPYLNEETGVVSALVNGGQDGTYVVLTFSVDLEDGGRLERDVRLRVENR